MPADTNPQGAIFGGRLLSLIDQAAFVEAIRQANKRYVTVAFDGVEFHRPVHVGDVLSLFAVTKRVGKTSMRIEVKVEAFRPSEGYSIDVTTAQVVVVAVDQEGRPTPIAPVATGKLA